MGFLTSLFGSSKNGRHTEPSHPFFAEISAELGDTIFEAPNHEEHLLQALKIADAYFSRQIVQIPGALNLTASGLGRDPVLTTLFHTADDVRFALGRSIEAREATPTLQRAGLEHGFALIGMRCRQNDQIPGHPPVFADHSMKCLTGSEAETRAAISNAARTRLLKSFVEHVDKLRRRSKLLRIEWDITNPHARGNNAHNTDEFVTAEQELTAENLLRGLCAWLANPAEYLQIKPGGARISVQMPGGAASTLELPVLHSADRRQWIVSIIKFPVAECAEALAQESRTHRYIYI